MNSLKSFIRRNKITLFFIFCSLISFSHISNCSKLKPDDYEQTGFFYLTMAFLSLVLIEYLNLQNFLKNKKDRE